MKTSEIYLFTFILSNISKVWLKTEGFSPINSFEKFIDFSKLKFSLEIVEM